MPRRHRATLIASSLAVLLCCASGGIATAAPTPGFIEEFATGLSTWQGGSTYSNPGSGGFLGAGDGYLRITNVFAGNLGAHSEGTEYAGNWITAGVDQVRFRLNDVGADEALEIHFGIGNTTNFWLYDTGFAPPNGAWGEFLVPLSGPIGWTRIIGTGTFADAIAAADRILVRHDRAPYQQRPDAIAGDFGLDHLVLRNASATPAAATSWGRIKRLYR